MAIRWMKNLIESKFNKKTFSKFCVFILKFFVLNMLFTSMFVANIPEKNLSYFLYGTLDASIKFFLVFTYIFFMVSNNYLVKIIYEEKNIFTKILLIICLPLLYFFNYLIINILLGVPVFFYLNPSLISFSKIYLCCSSVVILISLLQYRYIISTEDKSINFFNKIDKFLFK